MKKVLTVLMIFVLVFALAACGNDVVNDTKVPQSDQPQNNQQQNNQPQDVQQNGQQDVPQDVNRKTGDGQQAAAGNDNYVGEEKAKQIALGDAGVAEGDTQRLNVKFDMDDGRPEYDVDFHVGKTEYDYEIDAVTGKILDKDVEHDDID